MKRFEKIRETGNYMLDLGGSTVSGGFAFLSSGLFPTEMNGRHFMPIGIFIRRDALPSVKSMM